MGVININDIGNIKTEKGNWFRVLWQKLTQLVIFKNRIDGIEHVAPSARNECEAKKNAKDEADKIER